MTALKSSIVRGIKRSVCEQYPSIEEYIDDIIPKDGTKEGKGKDKMTFVVVEGEALFIRIREGPYFPTLRLLHKCALMWKAVLSTGEHRAEAVGGWCFF